MADLKPPENGNDNGNTNVIDERYDILQKLQSGGKISTVEEMQRFLDQFKQLKETCNQNETKPLENTHENTNETKTPENSNENSNENKTDETLKEIKTNLILMQLANKVCKVLEDPAIKKRLEKYLKPRKSMNGDQVIKKILKHNGWYHDWLELCRNRDVSGLCEMNDLLRVYIKNQLKLKRRIGDVDDDDVTESDTEEEEVEEEKENDDEDEDDEEEDENGYEEEDVEEDEDEEEDEENSEENSDEDDDGECPTPNSDSDGSLDLSCQELENALTVLKKTKSSLSRYACSKHGIDGDEEEDSDEEEDDEEEEEEEEEDSLSACSQPVSHP